jgi:carboxyl-terminal processing protease
MAEGKGGIQPDFVVHPEGGSRLAVVIEATGSFPAFATAYISRVKKLPDNFDVTPALLDEFQAYLSQRDIRPGVADWSRDREWIRSRLKQEILNQGAGVEKGDEVEVQRDPAVRKAVEEVSKSSV